VHRQLQRDYREDDLRSEGLRIFTTLDRAPSTTQNRQLTLRLDKLKRHAKFPPIHWKVLWW